MYERLILMRELLSQNGFIAVHMNAARSHYINMIMDEVFGDHNFRNEIIVRRIRKSYTEGNGVSSLNEGVDYLLIYSLDPSTRFHPPLKHAPKEERWHGFDAPNIRLNLSYELFGKMPPAGRHWMKSKEEVKKMITSGDLRANSTTGAPEYRLEATDYITRDTLWDDVTAYSFSTGYPTEKKERMLEILISSFTEKGDVVADFFVGSGTTPAVAQKLGRNWLAGDINAGAIQTTSKRLQDIIARQKGKKSEQTATSRSFRVFKVNDYDLQIQHNEALEFAIDKIGIERTPQDGFFEGVVGDRLVKIIPLNRPANIADLDSIDREIAEIRPDDTRDILVVALGAETNVRPWIEEKNKLREHAKNNRYELKDLRDTGFFEHRPAEADIAVKKEDGTVKVGVRDFHSPTICARLDIANERSVIRAEIPDFRSQIDCVMIDLDYDGKVFDIDYSDLPAKKTDLVKGAYEFDAERCGKTVAIKVIDMLGEEVFLLPSRQIHASVERNLK